jgi:hypothetical protein
MNPRFTFLTVLLTASICSVPGASFAQATKRASEQVFQGCLQGDPSKGFSLKTLARTTAGTPGQIKTYRIVWPKGFEPGALSNKTIEARGTLSTESGNTGQIPSTDALGGRRVVDSNDTVKASPEAGVQMWADGTLTVRTARQVANSCAVGLK